MKRTNNPGSIIVIESNNINEFGGKIWNPTFVKSAGIKKPALTRRKAEPKPPYYDLLIKLLDSGKFTRNQIIERITKRYPETSKMQLMADLMNGLNPKFNKFPKLLLKGKNDFLSFSNE